MATGPMLFQFFRSGYDDLIRDRDFDVMFKVFVVGFGEVGAKMNAPAFASLAGAVGDKSTNGEHVLTLPSLGIIKNFVHDITAPEVDNFDGFIEPLGVSLDADVAPHDGPERIGNVGHVQSGPLRRWNIIIDGFSFDFAVVGDDISGGIFTADFAHNQPLEE